MLPTTRLRTTFLLSGSVLAPLDLPEPDNPTPWSRAAAAQVKDDTMEELFGSEPESASDAEEDAKPAKAQRKRKSEPEAKRPAQAKKRAKNAEAEGAALAPIS